MPSDAGMPLCGSNPLWAEVQLLTVERDRLERALQENADLVATALGLPPTLQPAEKAWWVYAMERFAAGQVEKVTAERDELRAKLDDPDYQYAGGRIRREAILYRNAQAEELHQQLAATLAKVQALTAERDELRAQLATARALLADFQGVANRLRAAMREEPRRFVCPYCQQVVTDLQYHEGPADCERERQLRDQPPRLMDDTDPRG